MVKLKEHVILTKSNIKQVLKCKDEYAYTFLNRMQKKGKIKKIIKGKYTTQDDIYLIATNLFTPCYLSFWACAYFKGYTEQIVNTIQIATTQQKKEIEFENYKINFHKLNKNFFFGYEKLKYGNFFIFLAEDEKLIIDSVYKEELMGNFGEIKKVFENAKINEKKVIEYLKKIGNKSLTKKIGFLLEKYKNLDISNKIDYKDKNIISLSKFMGNKKINKKWQIKYDL